MIRNICIPSSIRFLALAIFYFASGAAITHAAEQFVYFGTEGEPAQGIYVARLDLETGKLSPAKLAAKVGQSGFLAVHPTHNFLYCASHISQQDAADVERVSAFAIDRATGALKHLNDQSPDGDYPCHVSVDHSGHCLLVANYVSGNVAALPIKQDGALQNVASVGQHQGSSVNPKRQTGPFAHSINPDPTNRFALAADLGTDEVVVYNLDPAKAKLVRHGSVKLPPGSGPRHLAFHPNGRFAYVINELLNTIAVFAYDGQHGKLQSLQTIPTLPVDFDGENTSAEILVHPSGKFVYSSNRGHDTIAVFACDGETGKLKRVEHVPIRGKTPRNFGIDPTGTFLIVAGENSSTAALFRIDPSSGKLEFTGSKIEVPKPMCVKFVPLEKPQ